MLTAVIESHLSNDQFVKSREMRFSKVLVVSGFLLQFQKAYLHYFTNFNVEKYDVENLKNGYLANPENCSIGKYKTIELEEDLKETRFFRSDSVSRFTGILAERAKLRELINEKHFSRRWRRGGWYR